MVTGLNKSALLGNAVPEDERQAATVDSAKEVTAPEVTRIGKYEVLEVLGRGGMGVVYRAMDKQLGREVAIKTLTDGVANDAEMLSRFYEEGRKTGRLKHPHIVTVYDLGEDNGVPYIVMERVEGDPLDKLIRSDTPISMVDRIRIIEEVCTALGYAHSNNVIHRDVKPANIFVQPDGRAKLLDFGIARLEKRSQDLSLTRAGHIIGTIPYMAPERLKDKFIDGRSDIFSTGVVLHQLITGQLPFSGEDYVLMQKIMNEPHPPLSSLCSNCPQGLEAIVDRALAKSADDRYQTAEEMAADLNGVIEELRHEQVVAMLPEARRLIEVDDLTRARLVVQQILKVQNKHIEARELLSEIQRRMLQRQREERMQNFRQHAENSLNRKQFDQSLATIKEGLEVEPDNADLLALQETVRQEKKKQELIDEFLREADAARRRGDYESAIASAQEALKVDKSNSKILVLCNYLTAEAEQAQKKTQARALLDAARRQMDARCFDKALELLRKVEELDGTNPEVQILITDAQAGVDQLRRQAAIARLEERLSLAATFEQVQDCSQAIQDAMTAMPSESALFRLNTQADRRLKEHENQRLLEDTLQTCRELGPREALDLVRKARQRLPGEERLRSLESLLRSRIEQQSLNERRADFVLRAREALKNARYEDGIQILEACREDGLADDEVLALLEFAKTEAEEQRRQKLQRARVERASSMVNSGAFDEAIAFLEEALAESGDAALELLLEQATNARQELQRQIESAMASAGKLLQAGRRAEAIVQLRALPQEILTSTKVETAIAVLEDEVSVSVYRAEGRAYALLGSQFAAGHGIMQRVLAASDNAPATSRVAVAFLSREQNIADQVLTETAQKAQGLLRDNDRTAAEQLVRESGAVADFASSQGKTNWLAFVAGMNKKHFKSRARG